MAKNVVRVGHELVAHGTLAAAMVDFPAAFNAKLDQVQYVPKENRLQQDEAYQALPSWQHEQWDMSGDIYQDTFGYILMAALGVPTSAVVAGETVVWDSTFNPALDPPSLSLQWEQTIDYVQAFQALYGVLDELEVKFGNNEELTWTAKGFALPETNLAGGQYTPVVTTTKPNVNWQGQVTLGGGAFGSLVSCTLKWKRNRAPFYVINNTQAPKRMRKGMRGGSVEIVVDPDTAGYARYTAFGAATKEALTVLFEDAGTTIGTAAHPRFQFNTPNLVWKTGEIDVGSDTPLVKLTADKLLYDVTSGFSLSMLLRSTKQWSTL